MPLPTEKSSPTITPATAKMLVYGPPGVGKTTLGATLNPDKTVILATEPGTGGLEAYVQPITSWEEFLTTGAELAKTDSHPFDQCVVDTADELQRMCQEYVQRKLGIQHPSDLEYGKGWDALSREWRRLAGFCQSFGGGVMFTSHMKLEEVKKPVGTIDRAIPTLTGAAAKWLNGFVEFIFYASFVTDAEGVESRVIRTQPSELYVAKARTLRPMQDPIPLDPVALRKAMYEATLPESAKKKTNKKAAPEPAAA